MSLRAIVRAAGAAVILLHACAAAAATGPWFGTWQLDPARSTERPTASPYRRVTLEIAPSDDGLTVAYDMVGTRGGVTHVEWTGRFDGMDYAVQGVDSEMTNAYRPLTDRSYAITVKVEGTVVATAEVVVSPDGRMLRVIQRERGASGQAVETTAVYVRKR